MHVVKLLFYRSRRFSAVLVAVAVVVAILGSLSNHDVNAKENVTLKMTSKYFKLFRDSFNSFNLSNVAE